MGHNEVDLVRACIFEKLTENRYECIHTHTDRWAGKLTTHFKLY